MDFKVTWEINIEADSPREAAEEALNIQRSYSDAVVFRVELENSDFMPEYIDLNNAE